MLETILVGSILFLIAIFFYKQAVTDFRINQIEWSQHNQLISLRNENVPIVLRSIPSATFWTTADVISRSAYHAVSVFHEMTVSDWIHNTKSQTLCPWKHSHAEQLARVSGVGVWASKWVNPSVLSYQRFWTIPAYHCWAGNKGLHKTMAWTFLFATEGELHVTIMPESMEPFLPAEWRHLFPANITEKDTPFLKDMKYIDIILRPGTALFMPPHWFISWIQGETEQTDTTPLAMACTISYHTPISYMAFHLSPMSR